MKKIKILALSMWLIASGLQAASSSSCWDTFVYYITCGCLESSAARSGDGQSDQSSGEAESDQASSYESARGRREGLYLGEPRSDSSRGDSSMRTRRGAFATLLPALEETDRRELIDFLQTGISLLKSRATKRMVAKIELLASGKDRDDADDLFANPDDMKTLYATFYIDTRSSFLRASSIEEREAGFIEMLRLSLEANQANRAKLSEVTLAALKLLNLHKQKGISNCFRKAGLI